MFQAKLGTIQQRKKTTLLSRSYLRALTQKDKVTIIFNLYLHMHIQVVMVLEKTLEYNRVLVMVSWISERHLKLWTYPEGNLLVEAKNMLKELHLAYEININKDNQTCELQRTIICRLSTVWIRHIFRGNISDIIKRYYQTILLNDLGWPCGERV